MVFECSSFRIYSFILAKQGLKIRKSLARRIFLYSSPILVFIRSPLLNTVPLSRSRKISSCLTLFQGTIERYAQKMHCHTKTIEKLTLEMIIFLDYAVTAQFIYKWNGHLWKYIRLCNIEKGMDNNMPCSELIDWNKQNWKINICDE